MSDDKRIKKNINKILADDLDDLCTYINDLMSTIPQPIYVVNPAGVIVDANNALSDLSGIPLDEIIGMEHSCLFADDGVYRGVYSNGSVNGSELMLINRNGKKIPVCMYMKTGSVSSGNYSSVVALMDITGRKKAEEKAKRSTGKLLRAMENTIQAMVAMVEMRDPYTAGHQRRVAKLACAIAKQLGFSTDRLSGLRLSCLIHDIGKIRIPTETLTNPNKLSQAELEMIRTHSTAGYEILKNIKLPWPIAKIVLQHHEREDGSGYPNGLKGNEILLEAKILAVADVVEAMASHRPYRPALGIDAAIEEITANRGRLYDAVVVDSCVKLFSRKQFKFE